jgi:PmbA protein
LTRDACFEVLDSLRDGGLPVVEVYGKEGRGRRHALEAGFIQTQSRREQGWAVRAGDRHCSLFAAGVGLPTTDYAWPNPDGYALNLPEPGPSSRWQEPADFEAPLIGEVEARELFAGIARTLDRELPGARLSLACLDEGSAESVLVSSTGIDVDWRQRMAYLRLEAEWRGARVEAERSERAARLFHPVALARLLADRLVVLEDGTSPDKDRGEFVLAPAVGARILASLEPILIGEGAAERARRVLEGAGRGTSGSKFTVVDDGALAQGLLTAPVDGEGVPQGRRVLVERGSYRAPIREWRFTKPGEPIHGCIRRSSWRDIPRIGASHLFIDSDPECPAGDLIAGVTRGYYLVEVTGQPRVDWSTGRLSVPVCGFHLARGQAKAPLAGAWFETTVSGLFRSVQGAARDLAFLPLGAMVGSPSLLVSGPEIRSSPSR